MAGSKVVCLTEYIIDECKVPGRKILFLAKVIEFQNLENTGNCITRTNVYNHDFPKIDFLRI